LSHLIIRLGVTVNLPSFREKINRKKKINKEVFIASFKLIYLIILIYIDYMIYDPKENLHVNFCYLRICFSLLSEV